MQAQLGACDAQMMDCGLPSSESSNLPVRTKINLGRDSVSLNKCTPQLGQKRRCMVLPLSAGLVKSDSAL